MRDPLLQARGSHEDSRIRDPREYGYQFAPRADGEQAAIQVMAAAAVAGRAGAPLAAVASAACALGLAALQLAALK